MAEALSLRGHEVHVVTYHLGDRSTSLPFTVHRIRDIPSYTDCAPGPTLRKLLHLDPLLVYRFRQMMKTISFDVIHAHHYEGLLAASVGRFGNVPIVYDAHTLLASELPYYGRPGFRNVKMWAGRWVDRRLPRRAAHVIAVTQSICDVLGRDAGIAPDRITLIPNGVEGEHFAAVATEQAAPASMRRLMFAGNLAAYQGIDLLLEVFAVIRCRMSNVRLTVLTDSDFAPYWPIADRLQLRSAIEILNPEYVALPALLQSADVLLNPRPACDGIPQKLLNYMAAGRPIVSFAGSGKIIEHERTGLLVQDGNVQGFADATLRLLTTPALGARLGADAQKLVMQRYGWQQIAASVEDVYERVLERNPKPQGS